MIPLSQDSPKRVDDPVRLSPDVLEQLRDTEEERLAKLRRRIRIEGKVERRKRARARAAYQRMKRGPYLETNALGSQWVYIPSSWYNEEAVDLWNEIGAHFLEAEKAWVRPTRLPYKSEKYSPRKWLKWIKQRYFELYEDKLTEAKRALDAGKVYWGGNGNE